MPPSVASTMSSLFLWQAFTMHCITKATPIHFIDDKCHIKKLKSCRAGYYGCLSCELLLIPLGVDTHTNFPDKKIL